MKAVIYACYQSNNKRKKLSKVDMRLHELNIFTMSVVMQAF